MLLAILALVMGIENLVVRMLLEDLVTIKEIVEMGMIVMLEIHRSLILKQRRHMFKRQTKKCYNDIRA
jgi:hypothetical protein